MRREEQPQVDQLGLISKKKEETTSSLMAPTDEEDTFKNGTVGFSASQHPYSCSCPCRSSSQLFCPCKMICPCRKPFRLLCPCKMICPCKKLCPCRRLSHQLLLGQCWPCDD